MSGLEEKVDELEDSDNKEKIKWNISDQTCECKGIESIQ
jgi:hypothetical protein